MDQPSVIVSLAEEILWKRLASNAAIISALRERKLRHETSLPDMRRLLSRLGHVPRDLERLKIVHIAGSKGKGSVAAFVESVLRAHGLRTALFTSPHLIHPRERLRINGRALELVDFSRAVIDIYNRLEGECLPGLFRFMTLLAFDRMLELQARGQLDVAVVEVGMGGRYDSTNVVEAPVATAITSLAMEHVSSLGPTLGDIAHHKAGIAKPNVPLLSVPQPEEAVKVLVENAKTVGCPLQFVESLDLELPDSGKITLGIGGDHQRLNAALAVRLCRLWMGAVRGADFFDSKRVARGLAGTSWPGRHQEHIDPLGNHWFIDGAHTVESIEYAVRWFSQNASSRMDRVLLFYVSHDRPFAKLLKPLIDLHMTAQPFAEVIFVRPHSPMDPSQVDLSLQIQMSDFWLHETGMPASCCLSSHLLQRLERADYPGPRQIFATGSLYLAGDILRILNIPVA